MAASGLEDLKRMEGGWWRLRLRELLMSLSLSLSLLLLLLLVMSAGTCCRSNL